MRRRSSKQHISGILPTHKVSMECACGRIVENVGIHIKNVVCFRCVAMMVDPPAMVKTSASEEKRPRGWQFKTRYVSPSGKVYHKGREVHETDSNIRNDQTSSNSTSSGRNTNYKNKTVANTTRRRTKNRKKRE